MPNKSKVIITVGCRHLPMESNRAYRVSLDVGFEGFSHHKDTLKTEFIDNSNPDFNNQLVVDYVFEEKQILAASIIYKNAAQQEINFGHCLSNMGRIIHNGGIIEIPIKIEEKEMYNMKTSPILIVRLKEDSVKKNSFSMKMSGFDLDKKDLFGKSDPYIILYKRSDKGKWSRTYRTEIIKSNLNPEWRSIPICLNKLCDGDIHKEVLVRCFDWDGAEGDPEDMDAELDEIIGECLFTCNHLIDSENNTITAELINYKKQKKKRSYINSGKIQIFADFSMQSYTFLDYVFSGIDLNFIVAVDLSIPKLNIEDQIESIRLFNVTRQSNEYEVAIKAVIEILQEYDNDNQFPAFGFGAQIPPDFKECHEYPLNGDFKNAFCKGVDGVLRAYQTALRSVKPLNTAFFSPVIRQVNSLAKEHCDGSHYFVLLILTNGSVEDWVETKRSVIEASTLPVSIIVVGIGSGAFTDMKTLDQDFGLLKVGNEKALRDNVQFVPMRKFLRMAADGSKTIRWNKVALAKEVLAELPDQLVSYMKQNDLRPKFCNSLSLQKQIDMQKYPKELQHHKLRRCVTAHVNIRPNSGSDSEARKDRPDSALHADFFSNRSLRKTSTDLSYKNNDGNERNSSTRRK